MESFFIRYRNLLVLLGVLLAQIIGLAVQVRQTNAGRNTLDPADGPGVRLIRMWASAFVTPPERLIHMSKLGAGSFWENYIDLRHVREQNQDLQKTIDRMRLEQAALLEDARQGERLQAMLGFQEKYIYKTVAAQAIGSSGSDQSHDFYIDKGADYQLRPDMAVITADGIVGKVRDVFPHSAQVLAINDQTSGAGVILETTRIRGILRGNAFGQLQIVGILADNRIQPGEKVFTAGGDLIFPRGLPVGVVEKVVRDPERDSFIDVMVKPAARLNSLDEVLVITDSEPRFPAEDQQDLATSETLKGQEAAAIKEQKKVSEIMAERLPALIDPNLPPDQQPLHDSSNPNPVAHPPLALHPDRFTPGSLTSGSLTSGSAANSATGADSGSTPDETAKPAQTGTKASSQGGQDGKSSPKPKQPEKPTQAAKPKPQENP
jgi:rod shape-determining protein MreC